MAFRILPEVKLDSLPKMAAQKYVKNFLMDMVLVVIMIELCVALREVGLVKGELLTYVKAKPLNREHGHNSYNFIMVQR